MAERNEKNKPEKKIQAGAVSATIWQNETTNKNSESVTFRTVSLQRRYQDKEGKWQTAHSLRINDLPKASMALNKAYEYIVLKDTDTSTIDSEDIAAENLY